MPNMVGRATEWIWDHFRKSPLWNFFRDIPLLRGAVYFTRALKRSLNEPTACSTNVVDRDFTEKNDPWRYETSPLEQYRFKEQTAVLDEIRDGSRYGRGLEIGCAEGLYTEVIADRCERLLVLDISPTALDRASKRRQWPETVEFRRFDLRLDPIPGTFDLIVVTGVLEYFSRRKTFFELREKLVSALAPGGYLLVETTLTNPVVENSWWARYLIRGQWINFFFAQHPLLKLVVSRTIGPEICQNLGQMSPFVITLLRRGPSGGAP